MLCRSCSATLRWVRMESGKGMPVDPVPTPLTGNVAARLVGTRYVAGYVVTAKNPLRSGFTLFTAHWVSCDMKPRSKAPKTPPLF